MNTVANFFGVSAIIICTIALVLNVIAGAFGWAVVMGLCIVMNALMMLINNG